MIFPSSIPCKTPSIKCAIFIISFLMSTEDIDGTFEFSGLYAIYQNIARYNTSINVSDIYDELFIKHDSDENIIAKCNVFPSL